MMHNVMSLEIFCLVPCFFVSKADGCISNPISCPQHIYTLHGCCSSLYLPSAAFWEEEEDEFITTTKKSKKACLKEGEKIKVCIEDTLAKDTKKTMKWGSALEKAADKATRCANKVDDDDAKLACASSLFDLTDKYCPMSDFKKACDITSFEFEVFGKF